MLSWLMRSKKYRNWQTADLLVCVSFIIKEHSHVVCISISSSSSSNFMAVQVDRQILTIYPLQQCECIFNCEVKHGRSSLSNVMWKIVQCTSLHCASTNISHTHPMSNTVINYNSSIRLFILQKKAKCIILLVLNKKQQKKLTVHRWENQMTHMTIIIVLLT